MQLFDCDTCIWFDICDHLRLCSHYCPVEEPDPPKNVVELTRDEARLYWNMMYGTREEV